MMLAFDQIVGWRFLGRWWHQYADWTFPTNRSLKHTIPELYFLGAMDYY